MGRCGRRSGSSGRIVLRTGLIKISQLNFMEQRIDLLNEIFLNLQGIANWLPDNIETACRYMHKAEALIEVLEVKDCGFIGGFDEKSPLIKHSDFKLYDRFLALVNRYDSKSRIKKHSQFDVDNLCEYFKKLSELKGSI
jgi:hypothetical protein